MAVTSSWMSAWQPIRFTPTPLPDHAYLVTTDAAEAIQRSWTCTPAALANLPDRAFTDLWRRFRGLELLFGVPPALSTTPEHVADQRPPSPGDVA
eukprot:13006918-Alexandrium_andersonii.AAC.1